MQIPVFSVDPQSPVRHYDDSDQHSWSVSRGTLAMDGSSKVVLLFESARSYCVVEDFPMNWSLLPRTELMSLNEKGDSMAW